MWKMGKWSGVVSVESLKANKLCLSNLIAFCDGMTDWAEEERAVNVVCLDFSKAFDAVSRYILIGKLKECGLDEWIVRGLKTG